MQASTRCESLWVYREQGKMTGATTGPYSERSRVTPLLRKDQSVEVGKYLPDPVSLLSATKLSDSARGRMGTIPISRSSR